MKKDRGVMEERTGLSRFGAAAVVAWAVIAVSAGWTGANAQNFSENHQSSGATLSNWTQYSSSGGAATDVWAINTTDGIKANNNKAGFLINKNTITDDGTLIVKLSAANNDWSQRLAGIVFRYTNTSKYYAIMIDVPWINGTYGYGDIRFFKDTYPSNGNNSGGTLVSSGATAITGSELTVKIEIKGDEFTIYCNDVKKGTVTDSDNKSGKIGYIKVDDHNNSGRTYLSSSWTSAAPASYTITYNLDGGTAGTPANPASYTSATLPITLSNPTKTGFTFAGWTGSNGTTAQTTVTLPAGTTGDKTYTATWTAAAPTSYSITYNLDGGTAGTPANPASYTSATLPITLSNPTKAGFTFTGWTGSNGTTPQTTVTIAAGSTGNKTYTANWKEEVVTPTSYSITYNLDGGTAGTPANPQSYTSATLPITLSNPTKAGFTFTGWTGSNGTTPQTTVTLPAGTTGNKTYTATWTAVAAPTFTITFNPNGGTVSPATAETKADGTLADLPTPTLPGSNFDGWFTTANSGSLVTKSTKFTESATIYAHWTVIPPTAFTITFNANGGTVSPETGVTGADGTLSNNLPMPTRSGYNFGGWFMTADASGAEVTESHKFSADATIYAKWTVIPPTSFTITLDAAGGTVSMPYTQTGADSTLANLPEPTREGYIFNGWYTAPEGGKEITKNHKFSANGTIYAQWVKAAFNIVKIVGITYVDSSSSFLVNYRLEDNKTIQELNYVLATDSIGTEVVRSKKGIAMDDDVSKKGQTGTLNIPLGSDVKFDTKYWVHLYTSENGIPSADKSIYSAKTPSFRQQTIKVPVGGVGSVNDGRFKFDTSNWERYKDSITITVKAVNANDEPSTSESAVKTAGFIPVGQYAYKYSVDNSDFIYIRDLNPTLSVMMTDSIPDGYSRKDVSLYRWSGAYWEVVFDTKDDGTFFTAATAEGVATDVDKTFRLMINTSKPTVTIPFDDDVDIGGLIRSSFSVSSSNVGNCRVNMLSGSARGAAKLGLTEISGPEKGLSRTFSFTITPDTVENSANYGILAFIIVNSGGKDTAINVSYKVKSSAYEGFTVSNQLKVKENWFPFAAQVELTNNSIKGPLEKALYRGEDQIDVHDTLYRLFRYNKTEADKAGITNGWIEYAPGTNDDLFALKPSRLMWFKSSKGVNFDFGSATSISLRNSYDSIILPPNQWTDIVLPFRFNICLGDIISATNKANYLEFYRWKDGNKRYVAEPLMLVTADSSLELKGDNEPFTIFNNTNAPCTLRIQPKPAFLSRYHKDNWTPTKKALAKTSADAKSGGGTWHYTLRATVDNYELSNVLVGYNATDRAFAVPPSFGNESVVLVGEDGAEMGHHFGPSIANGSTYKLRFYNDGKMRKSFNFSAKPGPDTPLSSRVTFVKASTGEILSEGNSSQSITVAGMSHEDVFMIIGGSGYRAKAASANAGVKLTIGKINVNMAARSARINFYVPESGISHVDVSIYDIKGRQVWKASQTAKTAAWNTVEWNSRGSRRGAASNGLYIVRIKAVGAGGTVGAANKRIMFSM